MISSRLYELRTKYLGEDFHFDRLHPIRFYKVTFYKGYFSKDVPTISILIASDDIFCCYKYFDGDWGNTPFHYWEYLNRCKDDTVIQELSEREAEKFMMLQELAR